MSKGLRFALVAAILLAPYFLFAQSNEQIDAILGEEVATVGSAAYIALSAAELINDDTAPARAVTMAVEAGWVAPDAEPDDPATFGDLAYLLMEAMELDGGLMYRLFPGPRYAAREFVSQGWSPEKRGPTDQMTGQFAVRIAGNFLEMTEASR